VIIYNLALTLVTNPLTVIKRKMQSDRMGQFTSSWDCAKKTEILALYRGAPISLLNNTINGIVATYTYNTVNVILNGETFNNVRYLVGWLFGSEESQKKLA
jgi:hypothetical protein